jgi:hypothetical protein
VVVLANYTESITDFMAGDAFEIERTLTGIPTGQSITKAWLTIKAEQSDADDDAIVQKIITAVDSATDGQITDDGAGDGSAVVLFRLRPADTALLAGRGYFFDIQVLLSTGDPNTPIKGSIQALDEVTLATS